MYFGTQLVLWALGLHLYVRNCHYGGKGFPAETFSLQMEKVFCFLYFGGGVTLESHTRIGSTHSHAVVNHLHEGFACVFDEQFYFGSTGIDSILHQLFDC